MSHNYDSTGNWGERTRWSVIQNAVSGQNQGERQAAWAYLVERYRGPVLRAVQRYLGTSADATDLAEDFFAYVYDHRVLERADRERGRFRCFMQGIIRNYALSIRRRQHNNGRILPIDEQDELNFSVTSNLEEEVEEAEWAAAVLDNSVQALLKVAPRDAALLLRSFGVPPFPKTEIEDMARESGLPINTVYQAIHRTKDKLRNCVLREVIQTVSTAAELDRERRMVESRLLAAHPGIFDTSEDP